MNRQQPLISDLTLTADDWEIIWDGEGMVSFDASAGITLQPKAATADTETHAALILSKRSETTPLQNFKATIVVTKNGQKLEVTIDGNPALSYDGAAEGAKPLFDVAGSIGLYTEDATVLVQSVSIEPL